MLSLSITRMDQPQPGWRWPFSFVREPPGERSTRSTTFVFFSGSMRTELSGSYAWRAADTRSRAISATRSGVKPNLVSKSLSGAEAPKVFIPTTAPPSPT